MTRRHRRYASYLRIAGKRSSISVASLARAAEVSERRAERDLQAMLEKGLWGEEAYLDLGRGMLFRSHEAAEDQERQERQRELRRCRRRRRRATPGCSAASAAPTTASQTRS